MAGCTPCARRRNKQAKLPDGERREFKAQSTPYGEPAPLARTGTPTTPSPYPPVTVRFSNGERKEYATKLEALAVISITGEGEIEENTKVPHK